MTRPPPGTENGLVAIARPDRSGRLSARGLLRAMEWEPGHRLSLEVDDGAIGIHGCAAGMHGVDERGALVLPSSAGRMAGVEPGTSVVLAAFVALDVLVVQPAHAVARLIVDSRRQSSMRRPLAR
jgi:hypothetical protein